jgi:hypothetical protein
VRRIVASALAAGLALAGTAHASSHEATVRALETDPVYVHGDMPDRLTVPERGRVRLQIVRSAIGRVKVAVVPAGVVARSGSIQEFASEVAVGAGLSGTLIVVAGNDYWAATSYPRSDQAAAALRTAVEAREDDRLVDELLPAIERIGRIDPGQDGGGGGQPAPPGEVLDADDFLDDIGDTFRLGVLIVAAAIALPFVLGVVLLLVRLRRRRAREAEVHEAGERSADADLVALGDEIRALDLDTSMPGASRAALAEYEQAIARYDQANELLEGEPTPYRVEQARAATAAGRRHIEAARERLG